MKTKGLNFCILAIRVLVAFTNKLNSQRFALYVHTTCKLDVYIPTITDFQNNLIAVIKVCKTWTSRNFGLVFSDPSKNWRFGYFALKIGTKDDEMPYFH